MFLVHKDGILSKLFPDGWLFRECWSEKVAEWWDFKGGAGVPQADRGKGCCRPAVRTKLTAVNQHQRLGAWVVLKAEEGEREGGSVVGAGLKHVLPVSLSLQILLLFSFKLLRLLCPWFQCKLFQSSIVSFDCLVSSFSSSYLPLNSPPWQFQWKYCLFTIFLQISCHPLLSLSQCYCQFCKEYSGSSLWPVSFLKLLVAKNPEVSVMLSSALCTWPRTSTD